jgi:hypothetical protein
LNISRRKTHVAKSPTTTPVALHQCQARVRVRVQAQVQSQVELGQVGASLAFSHETPSATLVWLVGVLRGASGVLEGDQQEGLRAHREGVA